MKYGLSEQTILQIQQVLARYPQVERALLYGSRAKGTYKTGSDIDLTLIGPELDSRLCDDIAEALDDLLLPYCIDLSVYQLLDHPDLQAHIQRVGQLFYQRPGPGSQNPRD